MKIYFIYAYQQMLNMTTSSVEVNQIGDLKESLERRSALCL